MNLLMFDVRSRFSADVWCDVTSDPWLARIPGLESSEDGCRIVLPSSGPVLDALRECLDAESTRGEGLRNLNVLLTSLAHNVDVSFLRYDVGVDFERLTSKYGEVDWAFDRVELYHDGQRVLAWWDGTDTRYGAYDIDHPNPEGEIRLENDSVPAIPTESLAELADLIEEVRALRDEGDVSESDRRIGMDILHVNQLTVEPSGQGTADPLDGPHDFDAPLEGIRFLLERTGSTIREARDPDLLWPVVFASIIYENEDAEEGKWTAVEREGRLRLARTVVERFAEAASDACDAADVYLFVGTEDDSPDGRDLISFDPNRCRSGTGRWWRVTDALGTFLDASSEACLSAIDEGFLREETVTMGIRTAVPFIASHRGCAMSEILDRADLGGGHTFGSLSVSDGGLNSFRVQSYDRGELESGLFAGFSATGGNDADYLITLAPFGTRFISPNRAYDARRLLQLLAEAPTGHGE